MSRKMVGTASLGMLTLILVSIISATAASNTVPRSNVGEHVGAIMANDLKPAECASLNLTAKLGGSGTINGTAAAELIVGSSGADRIDGLGGNDCIVGGAGNDTLIGGPGTDVCIGGTGNDTFDPSCETTSDPDPAPSCANPGNQRIVTDRDSYIQERSGSRNAGAEADLFVTSRNGQRNERSLIYFPLPNLPNGCSVTSATLRVYNKGPVGGRTIQALQLTANWTETGVTWNNQPATTGAAATSNSPSSASWQTWTVTGQVQSMYSTANHGLLLRDATEGSTASPQQNYTSREDSPNDPELVVNWG